MDNDRLKAIVYAQGWVATELDVLLANAPDDKKEEMQELVNSFAIIDKGLDDLRREHTALSHRLIMVQGAMNS